ncbi:MAG: OmpA family protein [Cyanobacteria bacterium P01_F01_bin.53]
MKLNINEQGNLSNGRHLEPSANELEALRQLLLGGAPEELVMRSLTPEVLGKLLPEAIVHSDESGLLTNAATPTVEDAIQTSIQRDSKVLAESLFPIIGPATRKSIASAIGNLVQSLNQTLEYSLSPQSFRWRLEARRTGKSFAEVVLLRTLVYQVEQVFLIHRETGLVLQHIEAEAITTQDPDLVSAMLTAIQDFVNDSFSVNPQTPAETTLDSLAVGDFTLWLEEGPQAVLACVIRGTAPQELRDVLRTTQEKIQLAFKSALDNFDGDQSALEGTRPYLEDCLQSRFKAQSTQAKPAPYDALLKWIKRPLSPTQKALAWVIMVCLSIGLVTAGILNHQAHQRWEAYVSRLDQQPGLVVLNHSERHGRYSLSGLQDPLAVDPASLLAATELPPQKVSMTWQPYLSLQPEIASKRLQILLAPPKTVTIRLDENQVLHLAGSAPAQWIQLAKQLSIGLSGVTGWDDQQLVVLESGMLDLTTLKRFQSQFDYPK